MTRGKIAIRWLIGLSLVASASLKLYGVGLVTTIQVGWLGQPGVQLLASEWELIIGIWLLSGSWPRAAWLATAVTFLALGAVSGYLTYTGTKSCGCLGVVATSPWWMLIMDVLVLLALLAIRPGRRTDEKASIPVMPITVASVMVVSTLVGIIVYGSPEVAISRLRGDSLAISPKHVHLGQGPVGATLESSVVIHNLGEAPLRIYGGTSDCSCIATSDLPLSIGGGEHKSISIRLRIPSSSLGTLSRSVEFMTDDNRFGRVQLTVTCQVVE